jgi:hypothetical protein
VLSTTVTVAEKAVGGGSGREWPEVGDKRGSGPDGPQVLVGQRGKERRGRPAALVGWARGQLGQRRIFSKETSQVARNVWAEIRSGC